MHVAQPTVSRVLSAFVNSFVSKASQHIQYTCPEMKQKSHAQLMISSKFQECRW